MPTQQLRVSSPGFLLDRLAADCAPLQEYRELTQNAIEAVQRAIAEGLIAEGEIVWDVDWPLVEEGKPYKLCVIDNGDGMDAHDILRYINQLAVSGAGNNQRLDGNFGIGAKITAGARNPVGVVYQSWKNGAGTMARFWRDPDENLYGLRQYQVGEDEWDHTAAIGGDIKPRFIKSHGTKVVLLGHDEDEHTALAPEGSVHANHWLTRYLNRRYFQFPDHVTVRVREFNRSNPADWPVSETAKAVEGAQLRTVPGHRSYLEKYSRARGTRDVEGARLHWWLLDTEIPGFTDQNRYWQAGGHMAALYQDELYEMKEGQTGRRLLMAFGVVFGTTRVVIYAEPTGSVAGLTTNTARSILLIDGSPLPWEKWAEEFRANMPSEIEAMMAEVAASANTDSHRQSIQERLKAIRQLFRLTRYRRSPNGSVQVAGDVEGGSTGTRGAERTAPRSGAGQGGSRRGTGDELYGGYISIDGDRADPIYPKLLEPNTEWRCAADGTRETPYLEDRAAEYIRELHTIYINGDFRVFMDMIDHFMRLYEGIDGAQVRITEAVREWFEQQLIEAVMGVRALEGSKLWDEEQINACLSPEALTASVMPRYHVYNQVKRQLGTQLRSLRELQQASQALA